MAPTSEEPLLAAGKAQKGGTILVWLMCGVSFAGNLLICVLLPFMPGAIESLHPSFGSTELLNSAIMSSFPLAMLLGSPLANAISCRFGRYALLKGGLSLSCASTLAFAYAPRLGGGRALPTLLLFVGARFLQGLGHAGSNLAMFALVVDAFEAALGTVMGINEIAIGVAFTCAPVVGSVLFALGGFSLPFVVVVAAILPMLGLAHAASVASPEPAPSAAAAAAAAAAAEGGGGGACAMRSILTGRLLFASAGLMLAMAVFGVCNGILVVHLHELGLSEGQAGISFGAFSGAYSVAAPLCGVASDRWAGCRPPRGGRLSHNRYQDVMSLGVLGSGLACAGFSLGPLAQAACGGALGARWGFELGLLCVLGAGQAAALIPSLAAVKAGAARIGLDGHPSDAGVDTNAVVTLYNIAMQLGLTAGPLLGGVASSALGFGRAQLLVGVLCVGYGGAGLLHRLLSGTQPAGLSAAATAALASGACPPAIGPSASAGSESSRGRSVQRAATGLAPAPRRVISRQATAPAREPPIWEGGELTIDAATLAQASTPQAGGTGMPMLGGSKAAVAFLRQSTLRRGSSALRVGGGSGGAGAQPAAP